MLRLIALLITLVLTESFSVKMRTSRNFGKVFATKEEVITEQTILEKAADDLRLARYREAKVKYAGSSIAGEITNEASLKSIQTSMDRLTLLKTLNDESVHDSIKLRRISNAASVGLIPEDEFRRRHSFCAGSLESGGLFKEWVSFDFEDKQVI